MTKTTDAMTKYLKSTLTPEQLAVIGIAADMEELRATVAGLADNGTHTALKNLDHEVAAVKSTLESRIESFAGRIATFQESLNTYDARLADLTEDNEAMARTIVAQSKRITTLEEILDAATKPEPKPKPGTTCQVCGKKLTPKQIARKNKTCSAQCSGRHSWVKTPNRAGRKLRKTITVVAGEGVRE